MSEPSHVNMCTKQIPQNTVLLVVVAVIEHLHSDLCLTLWFQACIFSCHGMSMDYCFLYFLCLVVSEVHGKSLRLHVLLLSGD